MVGTLLKVGSEGFTYAAAKKAPNRVIILSKVEDVGYFGTKTKVETESSQKNKKEKDKIMNYGCTVSPAKSKDRDVVKVVVGVGGRINWTSTFCLASG